MAGLTDSQRKALRIIAEHGPLMPREFARHMWPDSDSWSKWSNVGNGATQGVGIQRKAGQYLSGLEADGLLWRESIKKTNGEHSYFEYELSMKGERALEHEEDDVADEPGIATYTHPKAPPVAEYWPDAPFEGEPEAAVIARADLDLVSTKGEAQSMLDELRSINEDRRARAARWKIDCLQAALEGDTDD